MTDIAPLLLLVLFTVQVLGTVVYLLLIRRLFGRLARDHAVVYRSLGSPSLFLNNSIPNNVRVLRWLWRKEFEELSDSATVASARVVRTLLLTFSVNFAVLLFVFFGLGATVDA